MSKIQVIDKDSVISVHYRKLALTCAYCPADSTRVRVTYMEDGSPFIATMCKRHGDGEEAATAATDEGLKRRPGTSDYFNVAKLKEAIAEVERGKGS